MARICHTLQGQTRVWRHPFSNHLLHRTTWLGKQEVVYLPSPAVGQLGLGISKSSVFDTCPWRDCTISTLIEVEDHYTKRKNACGHEKCSPVADIFLHKGCCNTRKCARIHTPLIVSFVYVLAESMLNVPIINIEDVLHRCLPIHNDLFSGFCVLDRIRLVSALIS